MRHPKILADLDVEREPRPALGREQQIAAKGSLAPSDLDRLIGDILSGGEMPALIEFAVIGQEHLGDGAEQPPAMNDHAAIVEVSSVPQWRPGDKDGEKLAAGRNQSVELALHFVEH